MADIPHNPVPERDEPDFGRFHLIKILGRGGMASVHLADMEGAGGFSKRVALKLIHPHLSLQPEFNQWFQSEARLGGYLNHDHIVATYDFGENQGRFYLAMEYVDGPTLQHLIGNFRERGTVLPLDISLQFIIQVCQGLDYAHHAVDKLNQPLRMVHRDLKPSNILLNRSGTAKIGDFGVARAESNLNRTEYSGTLKGTVRYMSPEQAWGERTLDCRSDLFAVGAIFFEMLTSSPLYDAQSLERTMRQAQDADIKPRLESLPPGPIRAELAAFLEQTLARHPAERFQSAGDMADELEALLRRLPRPASRRQWMASLEPQLGDPEWTPTTLTPSQPRRNVVPETLPAQAVEGISAGTLDARGVVSQPVIPPPSPKPDEAGFPETGGGSGSKARIAVPPPSESSGGSGSRTPASPVSPPASADSTYRNVITGPGQISDRRTSLPGPTGVPQVLEATRVEQPVPPPLPVVPPSPLPLINHKPTPAPLQRFLALGALLVAVVAGVGVYRVESAKTGGTEPAPSEPGDHLTATAPPRMDAHRDPPPPVANHEARASVPGGPVGEGTPAVEPGLRKVTPEPTTPNEGTHNRKDDLPKFRGGTEPAHQKPESAGSSAHTLSSGKGPVTGKGDTSSSNDAAEAGNLTQPVVRRDPIQNATDTAPLVLNSRPASRVSIRIDGRPYAPSSPGDPVFVALGHHLLIFDGGPDRCLQADLVVTGETLHCMADLAARTVDCRRGGGGSLRLESQDCPKAHKD